MFDTLRNGIARQPRHRTARPPREAVQSELVRMQTMLERGADGRTVALVLTACQAGEGVSSLALGHARALARAGRQRVLLIDANLRSPDLHRRLSVPRGPGLVEQLAGDFALEKVVRELPEGFSFLPAGGDDAAVDADALVAGPAWGETLQALRGRFDVIVVDGPPLLEYPEAPMLGRAADGVILVLTAERTRWEVAQRGQTLLEGMGSKLLGVLLNRKPRYIPEAVYRFL